ncbi:MAG: hypothetical protein OXH31_06390 [Gammaproteobacteria bacterium]|nr:hypothetical protein [Gammaproteobacteria bacterium]
MVQLKQEVSDAIAEIRHDFPECVVDVAEDEEGGAYVTVGTIPLTSTYRQSDTWIGFHISFQYPRSDIYPHFTRPDLSRKDDQDLNANLARRAFHFDKEFQSKAAILISRSTRTWNPASDTASSKLKRVVEWLRDPR